MRLAQEWKRRRYRFLLNVIDRLPAHSRYARAVAQDDDLAAQLLHAEPPPPSGRPLYDWTPEVRELRALVDRMGIAIQYLSRGQYSPAPLDPPEQTALERLTVVIGWEAHRRRTAQLLPHDQEGDPDAVPG